MNDGALSKYSKGAIAFHWIIAILVISNIGIAELTEDFAKVERAPYMAFHKACGISILFLTLGRLGWRWTHPRPSLPSSLAGWEKMLAKTVHFIFYLLLIGLPLGGWLWMSTYGDKAAVSMFGLFNMPVLPVVGNEVLQEITHEGHEIGGKVMLGLVIIHILAALKHQFVDRMPFIRRMWP
ncbi:MAG: cytochrome b [Sphingorhabdus sp.]